MTLSTVANDETIAIAMQRDVRCPVLDQLPKVDIETKVAVRGTINSATAMRDRNRNRLR